MKLLFTGKDSHFTIISGLCASVLTNGRSLGFTPRSRSRSESLDSMGDYEAVQKGGLKLKGVSSHGEKKKKKKDKEKKKLEELVASTNREETSEVTVSRPSKTKAELAFERAKRKKNEQLILQRASKSHKERIMEFNQQLDNLTEHFDIPKVSWTK